MKWIVVLSLLPGLLFLLFIAGQFIFRGKTEIDDSRRNRPHDDEVKPPD